MLAALIHPSEAIEINTEPFARIARAVLGDSIFGPNPMTRTEYERALGLAQAIRKIMEDEWRWAPRDLWDIQGFIWAVAHQDDPPHDNEVEDSGAMPPHAPATNLILYGPPGTGKTYRTASEAVRLCDGAVPEGRTALMARYRELVDVGQIKFTTFHQSYAYEDFVEGLRPVTDHNEADDEGGAGFSLQPKAGIFREIATLAEEARKRGGGQGVFEMAQRRVFKMSLGRAGSEDHVFDAAIAGKYIAIGYGGELDWSDPRYGGDKGYEEIRARWIQDHPGKSGNDGNISQLWCLRASMREGDIVVISEGNSFFRAVAEVVGPYQFVPNEERGYFHQRPVRWLATFDEPLSVDTIYTKSFTMRACYELREQFLKKEALARLLSVRQEPSNAEPDQFVLVIDEINRANISKVFGELITLLEPGKRLGAQDALTVILPYSRISFGVPENLHIVGTMNTADRSIALLDTALRRRFEFRECMPEPGRLDEATTATGINLIKMLTIINQRIEYLFDREHQIGHAYLLGCRTRGDVDMAMRHRIIPLLTEYFYDDWSKVAVVLGDAGGANLFLERTPLPVPPGLTDAGDGEPRYRWSVKSPFERNCYDQFA
jgi:5-methylcytosine-specific restriction protein B